MTGLGFPRWFSQQQLVGNLYSPSSSFSQHHPPMSARSALPRPSSSTRDAPHASHAPHAPPTSTPAAPDQTFDTSTLPPSLLRLHQKQQEYASLQALQEASSALVARVEGIAEQSNMMADGGEGGW